MNDRGRGGHQTCCQCVTRAWRHSYVQYINASESLLSTISLVCYIHMHRHGSYFIIDCLHLGFSLCIVLALSQGGLPVDMCIVHVYIQLHYSEFHTYWVINKTLWHVNWLEMRSTNC